MRRAFTDGNVDPAVLFPGTVCDQMPEEHPVHDLRKLTKAMA